MLNERQLEDSAWLENRVNVLRRDVLPMVRKLDYDTPRLIVRGGES